MCESRDGGLTFAHRSITTETKGDVGHLLPLASGAVLAATWAHATPGVEGSAILSRSADGGTTWSDISAIGVRELIASQTAPDTVFLLGVDGSLHRSNDSGVTWEVALPTGELELFSIADAPGGGFLATTQHGLVHFE